MRFRFCGNDQCPQWVISEIEVLSALKPESIQLLVGQILQHASGVEWDYEEVSRLMEEAGEETEYLKGAIAAVHFILTSAAKHNVDDLSLVQEIQQLGLPQGNSIVIGMEYRDGKEALQKGLREDSLRLSRVVSTAWRVDVIDPVKENDQPDIAVKLRIIIDNKPQNGPFINTDIASTAMPTDNQNRKHGLLFNTSVEKLDLLILELTEARNILKSIEK